MSGFQLPSMEVAAAADGVALSNSLNAFACKCAPPRRAVGGLFALHLNGERALYVDAALTNVGNRARVTTRRKQYARYRQGRQNTRESS